MRTNISKFVLAASVSFAMALTLTSCAGSKPGAGSPMTAADDGFEDRSTPLDELQEICIKNQETEFCGVGEGTSTKQQVAKDIAAAAARNALAAEIQVQIKSMLQTGTLNSVNDEALQTTMSKISQDVGGKFSNVSIQETKTQFNKAEGKYKVFVRVSAKKEDVGSVAKNEISASKVLNDAAVSKVLMDVIDGQLNK